MTHPYRAKEVSKLNSPSISRAPGFTALIRAFGIAYVRSFRGTLFSLALPLLIIFIGELSAGSHPSNLDSWMTAAIALNTGLFSQGLFGYAVDLAHDRDLGVYRRLLCSPVSTWEILLSQLIVQWGGIVLQTTVVILAITEFYHASWVGIHVGLGLLVLFVTGNVTLFLGQWLCTMIRTAKTVTAVARLLLLGLLFSEGFFLKMSQWPTFFRHLADMMPVHLSVTMFDAVANASRWGMNDWRDLLGLLAYTVVFAGISLKFFRWTPV